MLRIAVLSALLSAVAMLAVPVTVAQAAECPEAGGADRPFDVDLEKVSGEDDIAVTGGGWGHGVGMSQYGAQGAARLGCTHQQILQTYYTGVTVEPIEMPSDVWVGFVDPSHPAGVDISAAVSTTPASAGGVAVPWRIDGCSSADCHPPDQPPGTTWKVSATDDGRYRISSSDPGDVIWEGGDSEKRLRAVHDGTVIRIEVPGFERRVKWGQTVFDSAEGEQLGKLYVIQRITAGSDHGAMERYLWGLAEVPSSWHEEALQAQAVAARSYAVNRQTFRSGCRCQLYATVKDQHYSGWDHEVDDYQGRWKKAVNDTAGNVMRYTDENGNRRVADGFYSSSHGGWSDAARDVWGGNVPYLQAVDTSRWEAESDNPRQRWTEGFTDEELASRFGFATFTDLTVENRGKGGRPTVQDVNDDGEAPDGAVAVGLDGDGETVRRWYSGEQLRSKLGVFSGLVHIKRLSDVPFARLADQEHRNRMGTSVAMSRHGWEQGAPNVVIARADDPADALAGATLSGQLDAPLLITPSDSLHEAIAEEVNRLGATTAYVLGGENAISPEVAAALEERTTVEAIDRVFGPSRVGTAVAIAERLQSASDSPSSSESPSESPSPSGSESQEAEAKRSAYLVYSAPGDPRAWPDALAVSGTAARRSAAGAPWPVLITGKELPDETLQELQDRSVTEVVIIGGTAVVPQTVEDRLVDEGFETRRLAGRTRYETSVKVATEDGAPPGTLLAATADNFPDGLSAGALAGKLNVTLLLVPTAELGDVSHAWVSGLEWETAELLVAGGTAAVTDQVVTQLRNALD